MYSTRVYPDTLVACVKCSQGNEDCTHLFFGVSLCHDDLDQAINPVSGCDIKDIFLELNQEGQARRRKEGTHIGDASDLMPAHEGDAI